MVARISGLTWRERQVAGLVAEGLTNKAIADELGISAQTVKNHMTAILRELRMANRVQIAVWFACQEWGRTQTEARGALG